ncbi:hypothetical protein CR513_20607, partial [Mucuna pruriens]
MEQKGEKYAKNANKGRKDVLFKEVILTKRVISAKTDSISVKPGFVAQQPNKERPNYYFLISDLCCTPIPQFTYCVAIAHGTVNDVKLSRSELPRSSRITLCRDYSGPISAEDKSAPSTQEFYH